MGLTWDGSLQNLDEFIGYIQVHRNQVVGQSLEINLKVVMMWDISFNKWELNLLAQLYFLQLLVLWGYKNQNHLLFSALEKLLYA